MTLPRIVIERCHYLAECTEEPGAITRSFASGAMKRAHALVSDWMGEAGMTGTRDNIGNLRSWVRTSIRCATLASTTGRWA